MWQLKLTFLLALALTVCQAKPSHHFHHLDQHFDHHLAPLHQPFPDHVDYAAPFLQLPEPVLPAPFAAPLPAPAPVWPAPAPAPVALPAAAPVWTAPAPAPLLPAAAPAPLWPAPAALAPAPLLPAAPAPLLPAAPVPCLPPVAPAHTHLLPTAELHLPTVTQVLPPVLEALPFTSSYRAIPGPKTTSHRVSYGFAYPKLVSAPHAHLRALPLKLAHHHHHHTLF